MASFVESATLRVVDQSTGPIKAINAALKELQATAKALAGVQGRAAGTQHTAAANAIRDQTKAQQELTRQTAVTAREQRAINREARAAAEERRAEARDKRDALRTVANENRAIRAEERATSRERRSERAEWQRDDARHFRRQREQVAEESRAARERRAERGAELREIREQRAATRFAERHYYGGSGQGGVVAPAARSFASGLGIGGVVGSYAGIAALNSAAYLAAAALRELAEATQKRDRTELQANVQASKAQREYYEDNVKKAREGEIFPITKDQHKRIFTSVLGDVTAYAGQEVTDPNTGRKYKLTAAQADVARAQGAMTYSTLLSKEVLPLMYAGNPEMANTEAAVKQGRKFIQMLNMMSFEAIDPATGRLTARARESATGLIMTTQGDPEMPWPMMKTAIANMKSLAFTASPEAIASTMWAVSNRGVRAANERFQASRLAGGLVDVKFLNESLFQMGAFRDPKRNKKGNIIAGTGTVVPLWDEAQQRFVTPDRDPQLFWPALLARQMYGEGTAGTPIPGLTGDKDFQKLVAQRQEQRLADETRLHGELSDEKKKEIRNQVRQEQELAYIAKKLAGAKQAGIQGVQDIWADREQQKAALEQARNQMKQGFKEAFGKSASAQLQNVVTAWTDAMGDAGERISRHWNLPEVFAGLANFIKQHPVGATVATGVTGAAAIGGVAMPFIALNASAGLLSKAAGALMTAAATLRGAGVVGAGAGAAAAGAGAGGAAAAGARGAGAAARTIAARAASLAAIGLRWGIRGLSVPAAILIDAANSPAGGVSDQKQLERHKAAQEGLAALQGKKQGREQEIKGLEDFLKLPDLPEGAKNLAKKRIAELRAELNILTKDIKVATDAFKEFADADKKKQLDDDRKQHVKILQDMRAAQLKQEMKVIEDIKNAEAAKNAQEIEDNTKKIMQDKEIQAAREVMRKQEEDIVEKKKKDDGERWKKAIEDERKRKIADRWKDVPTTGFGLPPGSIPRGVSPEGPMPPWAQGAQVTVPPPSEWPKADYKPGGADIQAVTDELDRAFGMFGNSVSQLGSESGKFTTAFESGATAIGASGTVAAGAIIAQAPTIGSTIGSAVASAIQAAVGSLSIQVHANVTQTPGNTGNNSVT